MTKTVVYAPPAQADLGEIGDYFFESSDTLPDRFVDAVENTVEFLARVSETSQIGTRYESDDPACQNIRICRVKGFTKDLIFYRIENSTLKILRVLHAARDYRNIMENENLTQKEN